MFRRNMSSNPSGNAEIRGSNIAPYGSGLLGFERGTDDGNERYPTKHEHEGNSYGQMRGAGAQGGKCVQRRRTTTEARFSLQNANSRPIRAENDGKLLCKTLLKEHQRINGHDCTGER